nr:hypothetical protein [Tanacetum cinerariifolium]
MGVRCVRWNFASNKKDEAKETWIEILEEFIINSVKYPIEQIVKETFPDFATKKNEAYSKARAIFTPQNDDADVINAYMFEKLPGPNITYNSVYEVWMPPHALSLNKGTPNNAITECKPKPWSMQWDTTDHH